MAQPLRIGLASHASIVNRQLRSIRADLEKAQSQALTGLKLIDPSDMPSAVQENDSLKAAILDQQTYMTNAEWAVGVQNAADAALGEASQVISRARELSILGATETTDARGRESIAIEIRQLREEMVNIGNTKMGDRFIFAGRDYLDEPFTDAGVYSGSSGRSEIKVGADAWSAVGWDGAGVFVDDEDVFALMDDLSTALDANDSDAVFGLIDRFDRALDATIDGREAVGLATNRADAASVLAENLELRLAERREAIVGADPYEALTDLMNLQTTFETTLRVASTSSRTSLFDYM